MDKIAAQEYLKQGTVYSGQGKYEEALSYYDKAEHENPMDLEVYLSKGIAYANLEQYDNAKEQFNKALKINRNSGITYYHLGSIAILENNIAEGLENYNKAIANGFDDAQLYYSLGLLHEENGETDLAIRNYSKAIQRDPMRPDIRIRKAQLLIQGGHYPEAIQALDETILTNPDVFEGYHIKFNVYLQLKQYDKAEEVINDGLTLFPKDPAFILDKVSLEIEKKHTEEAMKILSDLEKADETDDVVLRKIYMERAQIFADEENLGSAIASLKKAGELTEKEGKFDSEVVFLLANCYLGNEEYDKVLECAEKLLQNSSDGYIKETARYFKPLALKMLGRTEEAIPLYKEAIEEYRRQTLDDPGNLDAYTLRVMCLKDTEQYDKALELSEYIIGLRPDRAEPRIVKISILEAMGRTEEAENEAKIVGGILSDDSRGVQE